ncbi:ROK family protein [Anaerocolumna sedimenticola]|uniref:ROK family protein n=1 Tax=Anaerocolumna sedimenticola TaxID=2696063 RepID=A0A6P1TIS2_9FIRM|nr:ROK family protein [Anaerocolumna sedimenticola]QHQ61100.1 ROK family protein [Anaerocolumna sedimenticola]
MESIIGQSGEIGHTSIHFSGPKCDCGNTGCLDLYSNINSFELIVDRK